MTDKYKIPEGSLISFMSNKVKSTGGINLAQGIPGFKPPKALLNELNGLVYEDIHQYAHGLGDRKLLEQLESHYSPNYEVSVDDFLIVQGATEAIALIYIYLSQKFRDDFSVMTFEPWYESYENLPKIFDHKFHALELPLNGKIDFNKFEKAVKGNSIRLLMLSSPGNPFGRSFSKAELDR